MLASASRRKGYSCHQKSTSGMVSIKGALMAMAVIRAANGIAIPSVEDIGLSKRKTSGVFLLDFSVTKGPPRGSKISKRGTPEAELTNHGNSYFIELVVGSQKEHVNVRIDTGSSDLWVVPPDVNCTPNYLTFDLIPPNCTEGGTFDPTKSSTWKDLNTTFDDMYGDESSVVGTFGTDSVGIPNGPILSNFQFAVALQDNSGPGILGIAQSSSEFMTYLGAASYPNFPQALKDQGYINKIAYSIYLNEPSTKFGNIFFGGYDSEKFAGSLVKLPIASEVNLSVPLVSTTTAGGKSISVNGNAVLDSGSTAIYITQDVIDSVSDELEGSNGQYTCEQPDKDFIFNFNGVSIAIPYSSLVWPAQNRLGELLGYCLLALFNTTADSIVLGDTFLRSAYVLYDLEDRYISLAPVKYSNSSNLVSL